MRVIVINGKPYVEDEKYVGGYRPLTAEEEWRLIYDE
ncbi:hypothetical protein BkAM31D_02175 [Halalkalibacter krulwichiae]|uniref:Uncharacterized protein n=1 Tax=Halalkalibacter krulwichiae TaxID=199441 RepID=A0A1Y9THL0_9BACI|nr:hypothetical protein BkAM31D_02175 [Halalkalibacter krulwichiae]